MSMVFPQCKSNSYLKIYVEAVLDSLSTDGIYPEERVAEIEATRNCETRKHRLSAWRVFAGALSDLGLDIRNLNVRKLECGKWVCDETFFSISHSKNLVCVAVSSENVGVDIQSKEKDYSDAFAKRILTPNEYLRYVKLSEKDKINYIDTSWCKKESIMKTLNKNAFIPSEIETDEYNLYFESLNYNQDLYYLSVCSALADKMEFVDKKYRF